MDARRRPGAPGRRDAVSPAALRDDAGPRHHPSRGPARPFRVVPDRHSRVRLMDRLNLRLVALAALALVAAFLIGFLPQRARANRLSDALREKRYELQMARLEGRLGAALAESLRGNHERARQLMSDFYVELQGTVHRVGDAGQRQALDGILAQRDEVITLLSRAQPEATQRLMILYTTYFAAMDPAARGNPRIVTSPPPPPASTTPAPAQTPAPGPAKAEKEPAGK